MAIDITVPQSPGWWMARLATRLIYRQRRLQMLDNYMKGEPPLPIGVEVARDVYRAFNEICRSNFAELIVSAPRERMAIRGFRTAVADEDVGDADAWTLFKSCNLPLESDEVHEMMLSMGVGYVIVGFDDDTKAPIVTVEDPRQVIHMHDPVDRTKVVAALKLFHDDVQDMDFLYLYLPGKVYVAARQRKARQTSGDIAPLTFSAGAYNWYVPGDNYLVSAVLEPEEFDNLVPQSLPAGAEDIVPVIPFENKGSRGEFEGHIDILNRINFTLLQRMTITIFQAWRQRAIKGDLPETDDKGETIDYEKVFSADPGALWQVPALVDFWESGVVDLSPILNSIKSDVEHLAAVTRTPMHYFSPGEAAQSAEGASLTKEGLTFKTEDRTKRAGARWEQVMYLCFLFAGDKERAKQGALQTMWRPVERFSLSEMASASAQAVNALPWETLMEVVWQLSPEELARAKTQRTTDMVLAQQQAMLAAAANKSAPVVVQEPDNAPPAPLPPDDSGVD